MPLWRGPPPVRASRIAWAASWARLVQIFWPWIRQPPVTLVALVRNDARSDPASGSEKSWHQISSPVRIGRRKRRLAACDPKWAMVGPAKSSPIVLSRSGAPARSHSSPKIARIGSSSPCPPYSRGQVSPAYPASKSIACHCRQNGAFSTRSAGSGQGSSGRLFSSQVRRSWRNRASSGASERSIRHPPPRSSFKLYYRSDQKVSEARRVLVAATDQQTTAPAGQHLSGGAAGRQSLS